MKHKFNKVNLLKFACLIIEALKIIHSFVNNIFKLFKLISKIILILDYNLIY